MNYLSELPWYWSAIAMAVSVGLLLAEIWYLTRKRI